MQKPNQKSKVFKNKKAYFDYNILETIETGMELKGDEVKSIRLGKVQLAGSYAKILINKKQIPELFIVGLFIGSQKLDPQRTRKLLVHRAQIDKLLGQTTRRGYTLVPTKLYFKRGHAKLQIGLAKPKKKWDKRAAIKERELKRELKSF